MTASMPLHWLEAVSPVEGESSYEITDIEGEIPRELHGTLYRNGPSQKVMPAAGHGALHFFDGDAFVHAYRFDDGRVHFTGRYAKTEGFLYREEHGADRNNFYNFAVSDPDPEAQYRPPNTNVVHHGGRLLALMEATIPFELDPHDLGSLGWRELRQPMLGAATSAHPKIDGRTGQMVIHGYQPVEPYAQLYVVEPDGQCSLAEPLDLPYATMMHDLAITENHVIILLTPITFDVSEGTCIRDFLAWRPKLGLRFGIRRREPGSPLRWFDAPTPGFIFHPGNAYERDGKIFMDACTYPDGGALLEQLAGLRSGKTVPGSGAVPFLYEFDLETGVCRERQLDDRNAEFPRLDDRLVGYENRWGYAMVSEGQVLSEGSSVVLKYDRHGGPSVAHDYGRGRVPNEPVFVPRSPDADEDDGFVLNVVYDGRTKRSFLAVLDAKNFDKEPIAVAHLRGQVPMGFHGNFAPGVL